MLLTVYLLSRHPFSRRSCEADNSAVPHHPRGHGADWHAMDGLWGRELHQSQRPGGRLSHSNIQKTSSAFQCESALVRMTCRKNVVCHFFSAESNWIRVSLLQPAQCGQMWLSVCYEPHLIISDASCAGIRNRSHQLVFSWCKSRSLVGESVCLYEWDFLYCSSVSSVITIFYHDWSHFGSTTPEEFLWKLPHYDRVKISRVRTSARQLQRIADFFFAN